MSGYLLIHLKKKIYLKIRKLTAWIITLEITFYLFGFLCIKYLKFQISIFK